MDSPRCFRFIVAYDGTAFGGWQIQPNVVTVQEMLEQALRKIIGQSVKIHGSGRTDRGVHAAGQVAHSYLAGNWKPVALMCALNSQLPPDIRILKVARAAADFHARRSATGKEYRYFIWNGAILPPFLRFYRTHVRIPLDVEAMRQASLQLVGRHDFAAFTANPNRPVETTVRRIDKLDIMRRGSEIRIVVQGDGFLYKMVRSLAGFLIQVGTGSLTADDATVILKSRVRTARVPTAPPQGLFLWRVFYR